MKVKKDHFIFGHRGKFKDSNWSVTYAITALVLFVTCLVISFMNKGMGGMLLGIVGIISMILNIIGIVLAVRSLKGDDIYFLTAFIGLILNCIMVVMYIILIIIGFVI